MKVFVLIPAYNAEKTISRVFNRIPKKMLKLIDKFIVVDDGSKDNTRKIVKKLSKNYKIKLISHKKNKGYGGAQKTGFMHALRNGCDLVVLIHADEQYAPEEMEKIIKPIIYSNADLVLGSRMIKQNPLKRGMPIYKYLGNRFLTKFENFILGVKISEYHTGYRAYSKKALKKLNFQKYTNYFHFDSEILFEAVEKRMKIKEVPIKTFYFKEKSYLNPMKYGVCIILLAIKYKIKKCHILNNFLFNS